ncbi:MAG TPA: response regulator [Verrucomicrobiaceae bacterium]|jgi:FixJ family two-component response regulator
MLFLMSTLATFSSIVSSTLDFPSGALVCVVDDDASLRRSLSRLFRSMGLRAETFSSAQDYLDHAAHDGPCCLVLDVCMPGLDGLELQRAIASREEQIVFLSGHCDVPMCAQAMKAGAVDFLTKPVDEEALMTCVSQALVRSAKMRQAGQGRAEARTRIAMLTPREMEVMQCVIAGLLNKQIAAELGAAEKTIKIHRGRVMEKTGVGSVADLVRLAQAAGMKSVTAASGP